MCELDVDFDFLATCQLECMNGVFKIGVLDAELLAKMGVSRCTYCRYAISTNKICEGSQRIAEHQFFLHTILIIENNVEGMSFATSRYPI